MKTKLFTTNAFFLLIGLVLMLGVQNTADALEFRESRTGDLQTIVTTNEFTVSLTISLGGNTTAIRNEDNQLVSDDGETRINSSGYPIEEIADTVYRTSSAAGSVSGFRRPVSGETGDQAATGAHVVDGSSDSAASVVDSEGRAIYTTNGGSTRATAVPDAKVPDVNRYHYNEEAIQILVPDGTTLIKVGNYRVNVTGGSGVTHSMNELASSMNEDKLTGSVRLTYRADAVGEKIITITDNTRTTDPSDYPEGVSAAPPLSFTIYVVPSLETITDLGFASGSGFESLTTGGYMIGNDHADTRIDTLFTTTGGSTTNAPVIYKVEGPGRLYVKRVYETTDGAANGSPTSQSRSTNTLPTSKAAPVYLDMNGGSNKVTAHVRDQNAAEEGRTVALIFNYAAIEIVDGNNQTGVPNSRLRDPLHIRVKDSKGRAVPGLAVSFDPSSTEILQPVIGSDVYLTTTNTWASTFSSDLRIFQATRTIPADPTADTAALVPTDRSGEAQVYLKVGAANTVSRTVMVSAGGATKTFYATSSVSTDIPSFEIVSGNNQRSAADGKVADPLVVRVLASNNQPLPEREVTFTTTKGFLTTTPGYALDTNPVNGPATQVKAKTDVNGKASVGYDLVNHEGASDVIAEISETGTAPYQRRVTFNINGGAAPTRDDSASDTSGNTSGDTTPTLSVSPTSITGQPGSTQTLTVTAGTQTAQVGNVVFGEFLNAGGSASPTSGTGTFTSTLTLPSTEGTYDLVVSIGTIRRTVTVTVSSAAAAADSGGRLSVRVEPFSGAPGTNATVHVTATDSDGDPADITVSLSATGGILSTASVKTGSDGTETVSLARGSTSGNENYVTVSATGYDAVRGRFIISGTETQQQQQQQQEQQAPPGEADSIEIDGSRSISGRVNQATRLRVRVLDANDRGVSGVRVTFRVIAPGKGRLSQRGTGTASQAETDSSGYATASLTPLGGDLTVEAKAARVSSPVRFNIDVDGATGDTGDATSDTTSPQTYNVGDKIPISLEGTLNFTNPRTLNGITYTCVGPGECVVSYGLVAKGQIQATPAKTATPREYEVGDKIPISLEDTLSFTGKHTVNGTIYTCVGPDDCVVSYGLVTKGQIEVTTATATTTPRTTEIDPEVLLSADRRPPMVWVDGGGIYALVGADVQEFASSLENVMNIAVSGDTLYWTEQTGENAGTINSVNLDGTGAKELVSIHAVPRGIAVDSVAQRLYWTNSQGWIQSSNLEGKARRNVISGGLQDPMGITVSDGWVYWTQGTGRIQAVNLTGTKAVRTISTGTNPADGIAVLESKVYWTEMTGKNAGTINSVNLDGTGAKQLVSIQAVPSGIAVDPVAKRLYWTNSQGWIQSSNLEGTARRNVAKGLGSPGGIALSANIKAPVAKSTPPKSTTTAANKYDVNGDGTVDAKDSDALIVAVAAGITDAKYDVNGDGKVDVNDVVAVTANRNGGAPGAPTLLGMKLNALEVDRLQEQIDLLIATNDRSPAAMRTLVYLQQLIVMARPEKTQLLANYPNPFNPETWIPYELATDTDVKLTIYNAQGVVVRVLQLGQQSAGYYTDRERAAYWDGRNALGEQVASGIYFYQLETDDMSSLRKMVILK